MTEAAPPDPDAELRTKLEETRRLVAARKLRYAQAMTAGVDPPAADLVAISKLETQIANMESYLRLRRLHRQRRQLGA